MIHTAGLWAHDGCCTTGPGGGSLALPVAQPPDRSAAGASSSTLEVSGLVRGAEAACGAGDTQDSWAPIPSATANRMLFMYQDTPVTCQGCDGILPEPVR